MGFMAAAAGCRRVAREAAGPPPGAPPAFGTAPAVGPRVSPATFAEAEKLVQVELSAAEREMAAGNWRSIDGAALRAAHRPARSSRSNRRSRPRRAGIPALPGQQAGPDRDRFIRGQAEPGPLPADDADIAFAPVTRLSRWIEARKLSSERLTRIYLDRLERFDPKLRCVITLTRDLALAQAQQADREIAAGQYRGPLHGIPWGAKDLLDTAGIPTTYGAEPFRNRVPARGCRGGQAPPRGRRRARRQAEPGRARAQRHLVRRPDDEPVAARGRLVRFERGPGRGHRRGTGRLLDRQRDGRQHRQPLACAAASPGCGPPTAACRAPAP